MAFVFKGITDLLKGSDKAICKDNYIQAHLIITQFYKHPELQQQKTETNQEWNKLFSAAVGCWCVCSA